MFSSKNFLLCSLAGSFFLAEATSIGFLNTSNSEITVIASKTPDYFGKAENWMDLKTIKPQEVYKSIFPLEDLKELSFFISGAGMGIPGYGTHNELLREARALVSVEAVKIVLTQRDGIVTGSVSSRLIVMPK
jgi:hypothetical protein